MSVDMATAQVDYAANLQPGTEPPIFEAALGQDEFPGPGTGAWLMVKTQL